MRNTRFDQRLGMPAFINIDERAWLKHAVRDATRGEFYKAKLLQAAKEYLACLDERTGAVLTMVSQRGDVAGSIHIDWQPRDVVRGIRELSDTEAQEIARKKGYPNARPREVKIYEG